MLRYAQILPYLKCDNNGLPINKSLKHPAYKITTDLAADLKKVFGKDYQDYLDINRPLEKKSHKKYRAAIYRNIVGQFRTRVIEMYRTIMQNDDYSVIFKQEKIFQEYTEKGIFSNVSLPEWFFTHFIKMCVDDANAVLAPVLKDIAKTDREYNKPTLKVFSSEGVIKLNDDFCVLRGDEKTEIDVNGTIQKIGRNLYFYDRDSMLICKQVAKTNNPKSTETNYVWEIIGQNVYYDDLGNVLEIAPMMHNNGNVVPAMRIGHILGDMIDGDVQVFESEMADAIPHLKNIQQRASDKEIEILQKMFSLEWYFTTRKNCNAPGCKDGWLDKRDPENPNSGKLVKIKCPNCDNQGFPVNGLERIILTPDDINGGVDDVKSLNVPLPPAGTVQRDIKIIGEIRTEILTEWEAAYECINMAWIKKIQMMESGYSKDVDRHEYYKRLANISLHLRKFLKLSYRWTANIMFATVGDVEKYIPEVNTPVDSFNLATDREVLDDIGVAIKNNIDGTLINGLIERYSEKSFGKNTNETKLVKLKNSVDPYGSVREKDKSKTLMVNLFGFIKIGGAESPEVKNLMNKTYLSLNLDLIIADCMAADPGFLDLDLNVQREIINTQLLNYLPKTISSDIYKPIKVEPLVNEIEV